MIRLPWGCRKHDAFQANVDHGRALTDYPAQGRQCNGWPAPLEVFNTPTRSIDLPVVAHTRNAGHKAECNHSHQRAVERIPRPGASRPGKWQSGPGHKWKSGLAGFKFRRWGSVLIAPGRQSKCGNLPGLEMQSEKSRTDTPVQLVPRPITRRCGNKIFFRFKGPS